MDNEEKGGEAFPKQKFTTTPLVVVVIKVKVKVRTIAVCKQPHRYGNSRAIWDHTVLPATRQR